MSITNSTFALIGPAQKDGRQYVRETHTDNIGLPHVVDYLAAVNANYTAIMNARVPLIAEQIAQDEYLLAVAANVRPVLNYNTVAQFATRFRAAYKDATKAEAAALAYWIIERINAGDITDAQVRNAFGLTQNQYDNLKTNLFIPQHNAWASVLVAAGQ